MYNARSEGVQNESRRRGPDTLWELLKTMPLYAHITFTLVSIFASPTFLGL